MSASHGALAWAGLTDLSRLVCTIANLAMNTWGEGPLVDLAEALLRQHLGNIDKAA